MDTFKLVAILAIALRVSGEEPVCFSDEVEEPCHAGYRWRFVDGECLRKSVCSLEGANKFTTKTECLQHCDPTNECVSPQVEPECADGDRWRFNPDSGDCSLQTVCGLEGQNKFETKRECLQHCNPTSNCVTPTTEENCFSGYKWRFDPDTGFCIFQRVCKRTGQNKFNNIKACMTECNPSDILLLSSSSKKHCVFPPFENLCYAGQRWRFIPATEECELRGVCDLNGPNTYPTMQACMAKCSDKDADEYCSGPAIDPTARCVEQYAWWYNKEKGECEYTAVCPLTGPNKYEHEMDCLNACQPCSAPATLPNVRCAEVNAWRYDGLKCVLEPVCPDEGANRYSSQKECERACSPSFPK